MFNGDKETQQAATQKLLETVTYLRRANDSLMTIQPIMKEHSDSNEIRQDRKVIRDLADSWEEIYLRAAKEAYSG